MTYAGFIRDGTHYKYDPDPAQGRPDFGRGDVADILWVAANFFLSAAITVSGFHQKQLEWPPETRRAHMAPLPENGLPNVTPDDLDFAVPPIKARAHAPQKGHLS